MTLSDYEECSAALAHVRRLITAAEAVTDPTERFKNVLMGKEAMTQATKFARRSWLAAAGLPVSDPNQTAIPGTVGGDDLVTGDLHRVDTASGVIETETDRDGRFDDSGLPTEAELAEVEEDEAAPELVGGRRRR